MGKGEKSLLCDPGSELRQAACCVTPDLGYDQAACSVISDLSYDKQGERARREKRRTKIINEMGTIKKGVTPGRCVVSRVIRTAVVMGWSCVL